MQSDFLTDFTLFWKNGVLASSIKWSVFQLNCHRHHSPSPKLHMLLFLYFQEHSSIPSSCYSIHSSTISLLRVWFLASFQAGGSSGESGGGYCGRRGGGDCGGSADGTISCITSPCMIVSGMYMQSTVLSFKYCDLGTHTSQVSTSLTKQRFPENSAITISRQNLCQSRSFTT